MKIYFYLLVVVLSFASCDTTRVFESTIDISEDGWRETQVLEYKIDIKDINQSFNLFYTVRYSSDYPNYNLYVKNLIADSAGKKIIDKLQGMDLFKPTSGVPYGNGFGGNLDYKILGIKNFAFPHKGLYVVKVKQYMRQDPLKGVHAFGIRLEKYNP